MIKEVSGVNDRTVVDQTLYSTVLDGNYSDSNSCFCTIARFKDKFCIVKGNETSSIRGVLSRFVSIIKGLSGNDTEDLDASSEKVPSKSANELLLTSSELINCDLAGTVLRLKGIFERGLKYFGAGVVGSVLDSNGFMPFSHSDFNWCPDLQLIYPYAECMRNVINYAPTFTGIYNELAFVSPIFEELIFRFGIQEIVLKKIPKSILNKIAPSYADVVDAKAMKIGRIAFAALLFSLAHAREYEPYCFTSKLVSHFVVGIALGAIQETTESTLLAVLCHSGLNIQDAYLWGHMYGAFR